MIASSSAHAADHPAASRHDVSIGHVLLVPRIVPPCTTALPIACFRSDHVTVDWRPLPIAHVKRLSGRSFGRTPHPEVRLTPPIQARSNIGFPNPAARQRRRAESANGIDAHHRPPRKGSQINAHGGPYASEQHRACPFQAPGRLRASPRTARHVDPSGDRTSSRLWSGRSARATDEGAEKVVTGAIISAYLTHAHLLTICCASLSPWSGAAGRSAAYRRYSFPQMLPDARLYDQSSFREAAMGLFYGPRAPMLLQHPNANRGLCSTFFDRTHSGG